MLFRRRLALACSLQSEFAIHGCIGFELVQLIAGRLDTKAVREFLGATASRFEVATISTVVRIKPTARTLAVVMSAA